MRGVWELLARHSLTCRIFVPGCQCDCGRYQGGGMTVTERVIYTERSETFDLPPADSQEDTA